MPKPRVTVIESPWSDQDAALLSVFIHDHTGQKFIRELKESLPKVDVNNPANTGLLHAGYQICLDKIKSMMSQVRPNVDATNPVWDHSRTE